jgi:protein ImuB
MGSGETRMNTASSRDQRYACVHCAEFPAQALLRLRPDLLGASIAVIEGRPPQEFVCAMNRHALREGVTLGMMRLDAETISELKLLARSHESEAAARTVLLECVSRFSPRIEDVSSGTSCSFVVDISGTEWLFGTSAHLAQRLRKALSAAGFRVSVSVSANYYAACMQAAAVSGITIIPDGGEAATLSKLSIASLHLEAMHCETFDLWGIRTLGELAALPEIDLITRLGHDARAWREQARGARTHMFQPIEPAFALTEYCEFEDPIEQMESLLFIGARMIDSLATRATNRALSLALINAHMKIEGGSVHSCVLRPALPSADRKFLLKLLQLQIAAHPPPAAVLSLQLTAEAGQSSSMQLGLFAPQTPEPSRLDVTLARIKAIVGEDRVGSPVLEDTRRAGSFSMENFVVNSKLSANASNEPRTAPTMAMRRVRPALLIRVVLHAEQPAAFRDADTQFNIMAAYGPWKSSGCWWSTGQWDVEEWDVLAARANGSPLACLIVCDRTRNEWRLEAYYD